MKRVRRITEKYRPHLAEIARLYIESGRNKSATERAARKQLGLESFKADCLRGWERNAEFAALMQVEAERQKQADKIVPEVRGLEKVAFYLDVESALKEQYEETRTGGKQGDPAPEKAATILAVIHRNSAEIRAEEKHLEDIRSARARNDFGRFMRNMIAWVKVRHSKSHATVFPILRDVLNHLDQVVAGKFDVE